MTIKIRFNTEKDKIDGSLPPWRVLVDGKEHFAETVTINTKTWTTLDEIAPDFFKWHITCDGRPEWDESGQKCVINER
jgi:hypothetical protein